MERAALLAILIAIPSVASARGPDDLLVGYSLMRITDVRLGDESRSVGIMRQNLAVEMGFDALTIGAVYQFATESGSEPVGETEHGLMLTLGYQLLLTDFLTLNGAGRIGISGGTNEAQPLYATDTDLKLELNAFSPEGFGPLAGRAVHPSLFGGGIVNKFGRVQLTGGAGVWWNGLGLHVVGLYSLNGVEDPANAGRHTDKAFAYLRNAGVSVSVGYDFELANTGVIHIEARKNFGFENSGNDLVFVLQYRHFLAEALVYE